MNSELTVAGVLLMTPEYASPEQFCGDPITTATDVYSLGLVLYELLAGHRALAVTGRTPREIALTIADRDPDKPSSAILRASDFDGADRDSQSLDPDTISDLRATTANKLHRRLRGDLDNIVLKALRKEPKNRYNSVDRFSDDLKRHLQAQPVLARKSTLRYVLEKFIARHKVVVTAAAAVTLTLAAGLVITLHEAQIARANELRAERRFDEVRSLANSLVFEVNDSIRQMPGATKVRRLLIERAQQYLEKLSGEAASNVPLLRELAEAYARLAAIQGDSTNPNVGNTAAALQSFRKSAALMESATALKPADAAIERELAQSYLRLSAALSRSGDKDASKQYLQKSESILKSQTATAENDNALGYLLAKAYELTAKRLATDNDLDGSLDYYRRAEAIYRQLHNSQPENETFLTEVSFSHKHVGAILAVQKQFSAALEQYQAARVIDEARVANNPQNLDYRYTLTFDYGDTGYILSQQGDFDGALEYYRKALEIRSELALADPSDARTNLGVATMLSYIGHNLALTKDYAGALKSYKSSLTTRENWAKHATGEVAPSYEAAFTAQHISEVYAEMAFATPTANKLEYCGDSKKWIQRAESIWAQAKAQDRNGSNAPGLDELTANIANCDAALARLESSVKSRPPSTAAR
jgi:non-specific serine/threonine protein kinase/serine/threonine-protein kinase